MHIEYGNLPSVHQYWSSETEAADEIIYTNIISSHFEEENPY